MGAEDDQVVSHPWHAASVREGGLIGLERNFCTIAMLSCVGRVLFNPPSRTRAQRVKENPPYAGC